MKLIILIILLGLNLASFSFAEGEGDLSQQVKGFFLVQYGDDGAKSWKLYGKSAEVDGGNIKISEPSGVVFGQKPMIKLKAREGSFDKEKHMAYLKDNVVIKSTDGTKLTTDFLYWDTENNNMFTEASVAIKKADFEVNGKGAVFDLDNKTTELKKDIIANINSQDSVFSGTADNGQRTTIVCDGPLRIDYNKNQATFRNNVKLRDAEGDVFADRLDVYFNKDTKRVRCVVARGNVRIVKEESVTYSEKAIYLARRGRVILPRRSKLVVKAVSE